MARRPWWREETSAANELIKKDKKDGAMTEDEQKSAEKNIQELTDKYIKNVESITDKKAKEIMQI